MRAVAGEGAERGFPAEGVKEFWCSCFWMLSIEEMACLPVMNQFLSSRTSIFWNHSSCFHENDRIKSHK